MTLNLPSFSTVNSADSFLGREQDSDIIELLKNYEEMSKTKLHVNIHEILALNNEVHEQKVVYARDRTICAHLCPMKHKRVEQHRNKSQNRVLKSDSPLYEHSCLLIQMKKTTK